MPQLNEFIEQVLKENNMQEDPKAIEEYITNEAEERADGNQCVAISDEDVRNMIINYPTLAAEKKQKAEEAAKQKELEKLRLQEEALEKAKEAERKRAEKIEKDKSKELDKQNAGEQQSLF